MKLLKKNVILSYSIFLLLLSIGCGMVGYYGADKIQTTQEGLDQLTWAMELTDKYDAIATADEKDQFIASCAADNKDYLIQADGTVIRSLPSDEIYENGCYDYEEDGMAGIKDSSGKVIIKAAYDYIINENDYFIAYEEENIPTIYNVKGERLYQETEAADMYYIQDDLFYVFLWANGDTYFLHAETQKKETKKWDSITFDQISVDEQGKYWGECAGIHYPLDENFDMIEGGTVYSAFGELSEGLRYVEILDTKTDRVTPCYIDKQEEIVFTLEGVPVDDAGSFHEGKALIQRGKELICVDKTGKELFKLKINRRRSAFMFYDTYSYSEGLAAVSLDGDKYGYINEQGEFVVPAIFDYARDCKNGYAPVSVYSSGSESNHQCGILDLRQGGVKDVE